MRGYERQQAIRSRCFHPSGSFIEFNKDEVEQSIPERFEQIAAKYADRLAVKTKTCALTYESLNRAANRIARAILTYSGRREEPVALLLEKSARAIATILGVLKAGKMYLVLDTSFPSERTAFMLNDSQAKLIVTDSKNFSLADEVSGNNQTRLNIDDVDSKLSGENLGFSILPDAFAYIRYTSGSTGEPKGVLENHRNMLHNVMNVTNALHICADDRATLLGSLSTGQAATDMYAALLNGAGLYLWNTKQEGLGDLSKWLIQEKITFYRSSATTFRSFVDTLTGEEQFPQLRIIRLGSEPVLWKDVESYKKYFSTDCVIVNALSLGEARTVCLNVIDKETPVSGNTVPVGYALEGKEVLLIDDAGNQVGFNDSGEIAIGSRYLSPGYWRRPELTQAKFWPHPDGGDKRIYLTGDLGRMTPDGCLEYIGRKDFQTKVRGYRIELGEVEAGIMAQENIKDAVVVAREDQSERKETYLVAYIVTNAASPQSITALRRALNEKLPDYMVPSRFVFLETLPLTPNGKVDRRALPNPSRSRPELDTPYVRPRTPVERALARIWAEVLSLDEVGVHDNFLDLGGHSLAATRIISRVMNAFRLELPAQSLLQTPTVAEMVPLMLQAKVKEIGQEDLASILNELETISDQEAQDSLNKEYRKQL